MNEPNSDAHVYGFFLMEGGVKKNDELNFFNFFSKVLFSCYR